MKTIVSFAVAAAAAVFIGGCSSNSMSHQSASGQGGDIEQPTGMNTGNGDMAGENADLSQQDRQFVRKAAAGGAYEIQSSQVALQKTNDPNIRKIAQHMIHDHTEANQQLESLAQQKGIMVSPTPDSDQQQMIEQLRGLNGSEFDQKYLSQQTKAHKETIQMFKDESANGSDSALKNWASNTIPTLENHLRMLTQADNNGNNQQ